MCHTEVKRYVHPQSGEKRIVDRLHLCGRHHGKKPCNSHTVYDSNQWLPDPAAGLPSASPVGSLVTDTYSLPASPSLPPTPGSAANFEVREPSRSPSVKGKKPNRYSWGEKLTIVNNSRDKKKSAKYHKHQRSVSERGSLNSLENVMIVNAGNEPLVEAPMPPPAVPFQGNPNRFSFPPPPPPPPAPVNPFAAGPAPTALPESPTANRGQKLKPLVTGGFTRSAPIPMPAAASSSRTTAIFREVEPRTSTENSDDNEFRLRQDTREQLRQDTKRKQEEADRLMAEDMARKEKEEAGEELLATLEMNRFAERDRYRAEQNARREKEEREQLLQEQEDEARRLRREKKGKEKAVKTDKEDRHRREVQHKDEERQRRREQKEREKARNQEEERLAQRLAQLELEEEAARKMSEAEKHQRRKNDAKRKALERQHEEARLKRDEERQKYELFQARMRAEKLERELRDHGFDDGLQEFERRREELRQMEQQIQYRQDQLRSSHGPQLDEPRNVTFAPTDPQPRQPEVALVQEPRIPAALAGESWRERGQRIIAASQAQAEGQHRTEMLPGGTGPRGKYYYTPDGQKRYY